MRGGRVGGIGQAFDFPSLASAATAAAATTTTTSVNTATTNTYTLSYTYRLVHAMLNTTSPSARANVEYAINVTLAGEVVDYVLLGPGDVGRGWVGRSVAVGLGGGGGNGSAVDLGIQWGVVRDVGANSLWSELGLDEVQVVGLVGC